MSVKIRLLRMGRKKRPFYRLVVVDSRTKPRSGKYIEKVGHYDPMAQTDGVTIDENVALKWLERGAVPSDTVRNLLSKAGIMKKFADQDQ